MLLFDIIKSSDFKHKFVLQKIVCHLTGRDRDSLITHYDDIITPELFEEIKKLYDLYAIDHEPLEYILWYVEYWWLRFYVNKNTIIPRPETEYMIESVREYLDNEKLKIKNKKWYSQSWILNSQFVLVDVGTWSGVLWLSLLHSHGSQIDSAFLIDISEWALQVAAKNYLFCKENNQIRSDLSVVLTKWNLFDISVISNNKNLPIVVLANLPYIPDETFDTNPDLSIKYEPRVAFVGGDDGLDLYRIMFTQIRDSGYHTIMFLEMMTWQVDILRKEFEWLNFDEIKTFHFQIKIVKVKFK